MRLRQLSRNGFDGRNLKGMHLAFVAANGDIFTRAERVRSKPVAAFVIVFRRRIVVEYPALVLWSSSSADKEAVLIRFALPESSDATDIAVLLPERRIDVTARVERSREFVAVPPGPLGELPGTGEIEPDAFERMWKGAHGLASLHMRMLTHQAAVGQDCR
jgi:hypothetical protein